MTCRLESPQKGHGTSGREESVGSSPVMTQERVMGSLRSSIWTDKGEHWERIASTANSRGNFRTFGFEITNEDDALLCYNPPKPA